MTLYYFFFFFFSILYPNWLSMASSSRQSLATLTRSSRNILRPLISSICWRADDADLLQHRAVFADGDSLLGFALDEDGGVDVGRRFAALGELVDAHIDSVRDFVAQVMQAGFADQVRGDLFLV